MPGDVDPAELVARAASGDQGAYDALVGRFAGLVWRIARSHRLNNADAADVSQTVWLRLVEQLDRIREPERVGAWLATTARHECLAVLRKGARSVPTDDVAFEAATPLSLAVPAVDAGRVEADDRRSAVRAAFVELDDRCRMLLSLLHTDPPASYEEITAAMAMPVGSIGPTRQRCLEKLRRHPSIAGITGDPGDSPFGEELRTMDQEPDDDIAGTLHDVMADEYGELPDDVLAAARAAWTWRSVDAELAELLEEEALAVRSDLATVAYAAPGVVIDVERDGDVVTGQVSDLDGRPVDATVVVEVAGADGVRHAIEADVDAAGAFRAAVPAGRSRVAVTLPGLRRVVTPWLPA